MAEHIPAEVFPPGEILRDELEVRGWTQADLAEILGRPLQMVNEILAGRKAITPETARGLAAALGTSAEFWMNMESAYRLSKVQQSGDEVTQRARLYSLAPIKDMVRRKWIRGSENPTVLEEELKRFFEVSSLEEAPNLCFAARKSTDYRETTPAQQAWLCRAKKLARAVSAAAFTPKAFANRLAELRQLAASEHEIRRVPRLLAEIGVRLVVVEHLPKTHIDGAALWLNARTPVIVLSLRHDRIDAFWFTLCHELAHIRNRDQDSLDNDLVGEGQQPTAEKPGYEQRADREAADFLVPTQEIEDFILRVRPLFSKQKIIQFANRIQVHPGILVGQLQRRGEIKYSHSRETLVKVRDAVTAAALSDGWGQVPILE
jgi:HTH-type transcriptional regulator/antitoxin HigA